MIDKGATLGSSTIVLIGNLVSHPARAERGLNLVRAQSPACREAHFFSRSFQLRVTVKGARLPWLKSDK